MLKWTMPLKQSGRLLLAFLCAAGCQATILLELMSRDGMVVCADKRTIENTITTDTTRKLFAIGPATVFGAAGRTNFTFHNQTSFNVFTSIVDYFKMHSVP